MRLSAVTVFVGLALWMAAEVGPPLYAAVILGVGAIIALGERFFEAYVERRVRRDADVMVEALRTRIEKGIKDATH